MLAFRQVSVSANNGLFRAGKKRILSDVSFSLPDGGTLGIIGQSGSGKTTIANVILRLIRPSAGDVLIDGKPVRSGYSRLQLAKKVQLVTQNPETSFDPDMPVGESLREVLRIHRLPGRGAALENAVLPLLDEVGLHRVNLGKPPRFFSGGELQRMSIVRALLISPQIILFDEADSMLDTAVRLRLFDTLRALREKHGFSYVYITHDIRVLPYLVDTVLVIESGRVVWCGPVEQLRSSQEPEINRLWASLTLKSPGRKEFRKGLVHI